jgi:hypothetical protein
MDEFPVATTPSPGLHGVDWENRVDFGRLRDYRLARVREQLEASDLGAILLFAPVRRELIDEAATVWAFTAGSVLAFDAIRAYRRWSQ